MKTQDALRYVENLRNGLFGLDKLADVLTASALAESKMIEAQLKTEVLEKKIEALEVEEAKLQNVISQREEIEKRIPILEQRERELAQAIEKYTAEIAAL